jgi:dGTPase
VLGIAEGDFRRTRLTHSMEVAQIATGIGVRLKKKHEAELGDWLPKRELLEAICYAHDLGHPAFGHGGERALNNALLTSPLWKRSEFKDTPRVGFEGNGQTLRLLTSLEYHTPGYGLDLTRRTLLGVLKYPMHYTGVALPPPADTPPLFLVKWDEWKPPKCYLDNEIEAVQWILAPLSEKDRQRFLELDPPSEKKGKKVPAKTRYKSFDCSIMDVADEIAYGVHDFEDGIALHLITRDDWDHFVKPKFDNDWAAGVKMGTADEVAGQLFARGDYAADARKRAIGSLVNALISSVRLEQREGFEHPLVKYFVTYDGPAKKLQEALQEAIFCKIIDSQPVQTLEYRGAVNLLALFRAIESDPEHLLGGIFRDRLKGADGPAVLRVIADYIAGMTDEYATRLFERTFVPRHGTIFDRL